MKVYYIQYFNHYVNQFLLWTTSMDGYTHVDRPYASKYESDALAYKEELTNSEYLPFKLFRVCSEDIDLKHEEFSYYYQPIKRYFNYTIPDTKSLWGDYLFWKNVKERFEEIDKVRKNNLKC